MHFANGRPAPIVRRSGNGWCRQEGDKFKMKWVKLPKYCELSGDTPNAVHARRKKGHWVDGVHCQVRNKNLWINTEAVEQWVEQGLKRSSAGSG